MKRLRLCGPSDSAARDGDDVVERKVLCAHYAVAIVALALGDESAPPVRLAQFARPLPLALDVNGVGVEVEPVLGHCGIQPTEAW